MLFAMVAMVSCQKENVRVFDKTAGAGIAGTYSGSWSLVDDQGNTNEAPGTVVFAEVEGEPYQTQMTFTCESLGINAQTKANVAHAEDDYVYYNNKATELLPADAGEDVTVPSFQGRVHDGWTTFSYKLKTGKGKKAKITTYTFAGSLQ